MARMYENGSQIGASALVNSTSARGVFDANSAAHHSQNVAWPQYVPPFSPTYFMSVNLNTLYTWTPFGERSTTSNSTTAYRITTFEYVHGNSTSAPTFYLGYKMKNTTADGPSSVSTFYHDMTFAAWQIYRVSTSQVWSGGYPGSWQTTTTALTTSTFNSNPTALTYTNVVVSAGTANRWNQDTAGTGSSQTGMAHGISGSGVGTFPSATSGTSNFKNQTTNAPYVFVETSGAPNNGQFWLKSGTNYSSFVVGETYQYRLAHYLNTSNTYTTDNQAFADVCAIYIASS